MAEDFAVLDFALVDAPPREVARAMAKCEPAGDAPEAASTGLLGRLFGGRRNKAAPEPAALLIQPHGTLPQGVLAREMLDDMGFGGTDHEARLSAPVGTDGLTLIELRERTDGAPSPRLLALSRALGKAEVLAFRLSGGRHSGGEFAFTVYSGGSVTRRLQVYRTSGEAEWQPSQSGAAHPLEAKAQPESDAPGDLIPPSRQAALLAQLGIDADELLVNRNAYAEVLELSTRPGGTPTANLPEQTPASPEADTQDRGSWEDEVTQLLVDAVGDALPEHEQVPWLDALTADLEAGHTRAALERARELLARGNRPEALRRAAAQRLAQLFGLEE
ncbi:hypothetical protein FHY55_09775 [Oceanicola sp. D3]|uniref:hypothetical protein n=1 Tax=Oceanicola sp. D3 TaxID=2587163 RepID=UPI00111E68C7|nr:hypothetical protein [Oceanicola sp. D3]QDC09515.1 hypothetical protein FHY55_09775 [Oceanicola sp. D3]